MTRRRTRSVTNPGRARRRCEACGGSTNLLCSVCRLLLHARCWKDHAFMEEHLRAFTKPVIAVANHAGRGRGNGPAEA